MKIIPRVTPRPRINAALLLRILRGAYGAIFLFSGILKLSDIHAFSAALDAFMIVPPALLPSVAVTIPLLEIGLGLALLGDIKPRLVCGLTTATVAAFTGVVAEKLLEGAKVSCGCFGSLSSDAISGTTLIRNTLLIVWGILLMVFSSASARNPQRAESMMDRKKPANFIEASVPRDIGSAFQGRGLFTLTITVITALLALLSLLAVQNHELKNRLALMVDDRVLSVGETFPAFPQRDLAGNLIEIQYPQKDSLLTVLFIFSTGCKPCSDNLSQWETTAKALQSLKQCRVLGVSLDSLQVTRRYVQNKSLSFAVIVPAVAQFSRSRKISGTPETIVLDGYGRVMGVWVGVLDTIKNEDMLKLVHAHLQAVAT